jgi:hypothetical protein
MPGTEPAHPAGDGDAAPTDATSPEDLPADGTASGADTPSAASSGEVREDSADDVAPADGPPASDGGSPADEPVSEPADEPVGGAAPDDRASGESTYDAPPSVRGTVPAWWRWVGLHRKPVSLVAGLVVVAVVGTIVAVSVGGQGPRDVVQSYLDAIRSGDARAALEIAGEPDDEEDRLRFLSADALADDWTVDAVVERNVREDEADVDVTFRAGDIARQGRFHLLKGDDGWTMESPFVKVDLAVGDLDVVELGAVRQAADRDVTTQVVPLLLFPGVYELYPSLRERLAFDQPLLVVPPTAFNDGAVRVTAAYTLTDAGAAAAQEAVNAGVDKCATHKRARPPGCPFDISDDSTVRSLEEVTDIAWTIVTHPEAHFPATRTGIALVLRRPGTVKVTGTGVPEDGGARTPFTLTCEFGVDNLIIDVTADGVEIGNDVRDDYSAAVGTECF